MLINFLHDLTQEYITLNKAHNIISNQRKGEKKCTDKESAEKKDLTTRQEKCTKQHVLTARKNARSRSSRAATSLFTAGSVIKNIDHQEDIKESR